MKPLRPFPLPLNIGTDICHIARIYDILQKPGGGGLVRRILTEGERQRASARLAPLSRVTPTSTTTPRLGHVTRRQQQGRDPALWETAAFVAGRFAAKEAAIKAHGGHRRLTFHDITIERRELSGGEGAHESLLGSGPPVARIRAEGSGGDDADTSAMISISHDGEYATAVCLAYDASALHQGGRG